jgi:cyclic pyranopterin phosphate synthase
MAGTWFTGIICVRGFSMGDLSHFDEQGASRMVDVGEKAVTRRMARASGRVQMAVETLATIRARRMAKGD